MAGKGESVEMGKARPADIQAASMQEDGKIPNPAPKRNTVITDYEAKLAKARWGARVVGALQGVCWFLGYCNLTWATVVLMGGFVSSLFPADFRTVTFLLLLEAGRVACAIFFSRLLSKPLITLSQNPPLIKLKDNRPILAQALRVLSQVGQTIFIFPNIVFPIIRLRNMHTYTELNLLVSLKIFYSLALINAAIGLASVVCAIVCLMHLFDKEEQSIQKYYDEILRRTFENGIVEADEFNFFDFAFNIVLGNEFARHVQAATVKKHHKQLLHYMYAHRHGVEFLQIYLDWENAFVQQAAACVVGFWAEDKLDVYQKLPKSLFTKLEHKLGPGQVGWAAADSFGHLAELNAGVLLEKTTVLLATLMEMVDPTSMRSLVYVRALTNFVSTSKDTMKGNFILVQDLETMFRGAKIHRLRVLAGHILFNMEMLSKIEAFKSLIEAIDPTKDDYIHKQELDKLNELRELIDLQRLDKDELECQAQKGGKKNFVVKD